MKRARRKTAPKVVDGKVQRKNRSAETPNYYNTPQDVPVIDRRKPGHGYRHLIKKRELVDFISILPDWTELSKGLDAVGASHFGWRIFCIQSARRRGGWGAKTRRRPTPR